MLLNPCNPCCSQGCQCCAGDSGADVAAVDFTFAVDGLPDEFKLWMVFSPFPEYPIGPDEYNGWYVGTGTRDDIEQVILQHVADNEIDEIGGLWSTYYDCREITVTVDLNGDWVSSGAERQHSSCLAEWTYLGDFIEPPADLCHIEGLAYRYPATEKPAAISVRYEDFGRTTVDGPLGWYGEPVTVESTDSAGAMWFAIWYDPADPEAKQRGVYLLYDYTFGGLVRLKVEGATIEDDVAEAYTCDAMDVEISPDAARWKLLAPGAVDGDPGPENVIEQPEGLTVTLTSEPPPEA